MPSLTLSTLPSQQPTQQHPPHQEQQNHRLCPNLHIDTKQKASPLTLHPASFEHSSDTARSSSSASSSPVAPEYSPITPKVQPVLPADVTQAFVPPGNGGEFTFAVSDHDRTPALPVAGASHDGNLRHAPPPTVEVASSAQYMPQPPSLPFSLEDASDAIALRAAISTLQFQKQTAQQDLKVLADLKKMALSDPLRFKADLVAGRLTQKPPRQWDLDALLDGESSDDETHDDENDDESRNLTDDHMISEDTVSSLNKSTQQPPKTPGTAKSPSSRLPRIPPAQNVARMPHINWDKYNIVGAPLDEMHEQQRQWPGSEPYAPDKGRPFTVAAPYSPFQDILDDPR